MKTTSLDVFTGKIPVCTGCVVEASIVTTTLWTYCAPAEDAHPVAIAAAASMASHALRRAGALSRTLLSIGITSQPLIAGSG
jgi:hypothetical protein